MGRGVCDVVDAKYNEMNKTLEKYKAIKDVPVAYIQCVSTLDATVTAVCAHLAVPVWLMRGRCGAIARDSARRPPRVSHR